jgi:hypothetical protein
MSEKSFSLFGARGKDLKAVLLLVLATVFVGNNSALANINGAIFTTDSNCSGTNVNSFDLKTDVYLDGGPRKPGSAGLPDGNYYVQVTSPNGELLGTTYGTATPAPAHVTGGEFDTCYQLWAILKKASDGTQGYDDTPNNGGVYKVWITREDHFSWGSGVNGFDNPWSKTDNFKVEGTGQCPNPSVITVCKFDDLDANGIQDGNDTEIGWLVDVTDPCGSTNTYITPFDILASPSGNWQICEQVLSNWLQTALIIDGNSNSPTPCAAVAVNDDCGEEHTVVFGNIQLGSIEACKFYDRNGDGVKDACEPAVAGIRFTLDGNDIQGNVIDQNGVTDPEGCVIFEGLLPGSYTLCEVLPPSNWAATTDVCKTASLLEGDNLSFSFGNVCTGTAAFDTKGYWHNKNGLDETVQADFDYLNGLAPWSACVPDNKPFGPINGKYCSGTNPNGSNVPAVKIGKIVIAPAGSAKAEQSLFLVYNNGEVKLQLAQQLDAFIMNVRHRLGSPDTVIQKPDGTWISASDLIDQAISIWISGTVSERTGMSDLLDKLNNSGAVVYIHYDPCPVVYP